MTNDENLKQLWQKEKEQFAEDAKKIKTEVKYNYKEIKFGGVKKSKPPAAKLPSRNTTDLLLRQKLGI